MHKLERFIIYPLLIVALFYSFAGEQVITTAQDVIDKLIVREISVVDDSGKEVVNIKNGIMGGEILVNNLLSEKAHNVLDAVGLRLIGEKQNSVLTNKSLNIRDENYVTNILNHSISVKENTPWNEPFNEYIFLGINEAENGIARLNNSKGDSLIYIGSNYEGHGLINIYDKYGEDWRSYSFR